MVLWITILVILIVLVAPLAYALVKVIWTIHAKQTVAMVPARVETRIENFSEEMREIVGQSIEQFR